MPRKYLRPFLREVITRLDFASSVRDANTPLPKKLQASVLKLFPISEPRKIKFKELQVSVTTAASEEKEAEETYWVFHGKEKEKTLIMTPDHFDITYLKYRSFDVLKDDFLSLAEAMFRTYRDLQVKRFGLRYVNVIELQETDPFNWRDYLNNNLLSIFEVSEDKQNIARAFHNLQMNYGDMMLSFRYGMHNLDFPAVIRRKTFILDYDAYYEGLQDMVDIRESVDKFHEKIQTYFESSISDKLRRKMGVSRSAR